MTYEGEIQTCQVDSPWGASQSLSSQGNNTNRLQGNYSQRGKTQQRLAQRTTPGLCNNGPHRNKLKCFCFKIRDVSQLASAINLIHLARGNLTQGIAYSGEAC